MVRGLVDGTHPTNFVVDTGGEVISISTATARAPSTRSPTGRLRSRCTARRDGTATRSCCPASTCGFDAIEYRNFPVVVLNLRAPSVLLGFQVGGIVGHKFLSPYRVAIDLERSELRMSPAQASN